MTIQGTTCKLIEKKGKKAEIEIDGQRLLIGLDNLPEDCQENDQFHLYFLNPSAAKIKEKELARAILEQILNGEK
jgi:hypothetical protein